MSIVSRSLVVGATFAAFCAFGCDDKPQPATAPTADAHGHHEHDGHDHGHDHAHDEKGHVAGHGGKVVDLGTATAGAYTLKATRDQAPIEAGGDAPIDVVVTPAASAAKPVAVRFWIGTEDAKGSVKAKASVEDEKQPTLWHTHTDIPSPLPAGAKLWVEVEADGGAKSVAGFDLKP